MFRSLLLSCLCLCLLAGCGKKPSNVLDATGKPYLEKTYPAVESAP